jgi:hypothetical protein
MSSIYKQILDQEKAEQSAARPAPSAASSPYAAILAEEKAQAQQAMQPFLDMAVRISPERAATAQGLARSTGLPVDVVERNFDEVQRREQIRHMQTVLGKSPVLAQQMRDPQFAKMAHQDIDPLGGIEGALAVLKNSGRSMIAGLYGASAGVVGGVQSGADLIQMVTGPLADAGVLHNDLGGRLAHSLSAYRRGIEATASSYRTETSGILDGGFYSGLESLSRNLVSLPLLLFPGGQTATLTGMVAPVAGQEYGKARDAGLDVGRSATFGLSQAAIEWATEKIPVSRLLGDLSAGAPLRQVLMRQLAAEIPGEQVATVLQDLNEWAAIDVNSGKSFRDYLEERPSAAAQTLIATIVGTAGQTTVMHGIDRAVNRAARREQQARQADDAAQKFAELAQLSRAVSLTQTSPETFQQFMDAALEDGPVQDVLVSGQVLMQSGVAEELAKVSPAVAAQIQQAVETGGDVRIPVSEFAAKIAPTELADALIDHLKTDINPMSRAEAGQYLQNQVAELEQEMGEEVARTEEQVTFRAGVEAVRNALRDELNAVNRFRPEVNDAYATLVGEFFGALSQRVGLTPQQLFEKYRLRTVAENVAGEAQFEQNGAMDDASRVASEQAPDPAGDGKTGGAMPLVTTQHPALGMRVPVRVISSPGASGMQFSIENGESILRINPVFATDKQYVRTQMRNGYALNDFLWPFGEDVFIRTSDNPQDYEHLKKGTHRGSKNHATNETEGGLSVSREPAHAAGKYAYLVRGKVIGQGSDGEPLLDTPTAEVASKRMTFAQANQMLDAAIKERARAMGLSDDQLRALRTAADLDFSRMNEPSAPAGSGAYSQGARGSFDPATSTIALLKGADLSTFLHESGHFFLEVMLDTAATARSYSADQLTDGERGVVRDADALMQWFGLPDLAAWHALDFEEKRAYHEKFAESFEAYLLEGNAPSIELQPLFQSFRAWIIDAYKGIKAFFETNPAAGELSDEVRHVFDRMIATDEAIKTAEHARSMMPLFKNAEQAAAFGIADYTAYQAIDKDATATAQEELGARGVRDMQWLAGARSRALKRLQKEARALREQMEMEARREVMRQPVYQAWQLLTNKITREDRLLPAERRKSDPDVVDPSIDSLFVAIAKLGGIDRAQLEAEWGLDAKEKVAPPVFGKHVLRRNGGRGIDEMRTLLVQYGYLDPATDGPDFDPREFEGKFFDELGGMPVYSSNADYDYLAQANQRPGDQVANPAALLAGRLDRAALREMGVTTAQIDALRSRRMTAADGLHPDIVAELFGFDSGDALVQALVAAQDPATEIEALTDLYMLERHGDLASPQALERAADAAIHNDVRARMVATELNALAKATGKRAVLAQAAREYARQAIDRLRVRNVKPAQYAATEARAAKNADKAMKAGDIEVAAAEKRNHLVNIHLAKAAHKALDEVEAGLRYLKKFDGEGTRKSVDPDYLEQIDTLLERFDLRKGQSLKAIDKRTALAKWIEDRANEGTEPDIPQWLQVEAAREHYKNLTVEQFRGLVDAVKQIEHLGRLKHKLLTARDQRALDEIVAEIRASIEAAAGGRVVDNEERNTLGSKAAHMARGFMAEHRQLHSLVREMDGFRDGGPMWNYLIRPMNEAGDKEASMRADATRRLHELARPLLNDGQKMGGKGKYYPSLGRSLNRGERIAILLNWGNEGNRQRLLDGRGWTAEQLAPVLNGFTAAELQFAQGVWDFFESYRPQIAAKERRVTGKEPEWIDPSPFTAQTADGETVQMRGGYYPMKYDAKQSGTASKHEKAEEAKQMMRAAYTAATTRRSYTKSRAEKVTDMVVRLDFDGIYQGANEVIHDLAWHEWLIDSNRLMRRLDGTMRMRYGAQKVEAMNDAIKDIALGDQGARGMGEKILQHIRNGATIAGLGWNFTTAALQFTGITNSMVRIGTPWVARGIREFYGSPSHMMRKAEEAQAKSEFLRNRARTMNREINDIKNRLDAGKGDFQMALESSFFTFIQKAQAMVDYPTWYGAYEKAMADPALMREDGTVDESKAVAMADQAVIAAQSGGQIKDLAAWQRGGAFKKLFTNFISYFMTTLQLAAERTNQTNFKKPGEVIALAGDYLLLMVVPAIMGALIRAMMKGDMPDDEDELMELLLAEQISFLMGFSPVLRELTAGAQTLAGVGNGFGYSGPAGLRFFNDFYKLTVQIGQGEMDMALFKAANNTAGVLFHYPAGQVNRTVEGAVALIDGDTENPLAIVAGPPRK